MNMITITSALELGLLYTLMTFGLFISYRILDIPDLTVDGSFTLGASVSAIFTLKGDPVLGIFMGMVAGAMAGCVTALLQTKFKIQPILAGILTMTGLYSINIMIMHDKANISVFGSETIFSYAKELLGGNSTMIVGILITILASIILAMFLFTRIGLAIRATGDNESMVSASSINVDAMKIIGLSLANALVATSGGLIAQQQMYSDVQMGVGMVVIAIASLIIGEVIVDFIVKRRTIVSNIIGAIIGTLIYRFIITIALEVDITISAMKLVAAVLVAFAISCPVIYGYIKDKINQAQRTKLKPKKMNINSQSKQKTNSEREVL